MCLGPGSTPTRRRILKAEEHLYPASSEPTSTPGLRNPKGVYSPRLSMSTVVGSRVRFQILRMHLKKPKPTALELTLHVALSMLHP